MNGAASHALSPSAREASLIVELLQGKTVADAAAAIHVSKRTAFRLKARESFQRAFSQAKNELLSGTVAALHTHSLSFVDTLHVIANDPKVQPNARVQAAREALSALFKGVEIFDLTDRISKLEQLAGEGKK